MGSRGRVLLTLVVVATALLGCRRGQQPEPAAPPPLATVRVASLAPEHPAYAELQRLSAAVLPQESASSSPGVEEKAEALPQEGHSNEATSPGAAVLRLSGDRTVAGIAGDARALNGQHHRARKAHTPSSPKVSAQAAKEPRALAGRTDDVELRRRRLAEIVRRETVDACRQIAVQHGIELKLPPDVPTDAEDMTQGFRRLIREYWRQAGQAAQTAEGVTR